MCRPTTFSAVQIVSLLLAGATTGGCAHNAAATSSSVESSPAPAPAPVARKAQLVSAADASAAATDADAKAGAAALDAAVSELAGVDLFFGFNNDELTERARGKLTAVATVLTRYPKLKLRVAGNCDERGTEDYNLILGQKRADSAKKYLVDLGVGSGQVTTVSYGAERPKDPAHTEGAWQENRRDDVVVTQPGAAR